MRDVEHGDEGHRRQDVGCDHDQHDPHVRCPEDPRTPDIFPLPLGKRHAARDPRIGRPSRQHEDGHDGEEIGPGDAENGDGQNDQRHGELGIGETHEDRIHPSAPIAGHDAEPGSDHEHEDDAREGDAEAVAQPDQAADEQVAAKLVGAGGMGQGSAVEEKRGEKALLDADLGGRKRCQLGQDQGGKHQHREDRQAQLESAHGQGQTDHPPGHGLASRGERRQHALGDVGRHQYFSLRSI